MPTTAPARVVAAGPETRPATITVITKPDVVQPRSPAKPVHHPGLDGLRGLAVAGVLLFHSGFGWAVGGFLGVSTFFTLSGFLITGLLVAEWQRQGRIDLRRFWVRRARRLLPGLLALVGGILAYGAFVAPGDQLERLRHDGIATLGYVANWRFVLSGQSYGDLFAAPSPLLHMWSLAIEEQFYVVFPVLVASVMWLGRRFGRPLRTLALVLGGLTVASVATAVILAGGSESSRIYYGTDTRAAEVLIGALVAVAVAARGPARTAAGRHLVAGGGAIALLATLAAWSVVRHESGWLYRGGFGGYALMTGLVVAAAIHPGPVRWILSLRALRGLGLVSYGLYLYHWPVFLWLSEARTGLNPLALFALRMAVTVALALASYRWIEMPLRHGALPGWRSGLLAPAVATAVVVGLLWVTVPAAGPAQLASAVAGATTADVQPLVISAGSGDPAVRDVSATEPLRVLVTGDSVAYDAEPGIAAALEGTGEADVAQAALFGFGLTATADWRETWRTLIADHRPEVVVVMFGIWDDKFVTENGEEAYERVVDEAIGIFSGEGAKVLVVGMPASVTRDGLPLGRHPDAVFRRLPERWPGVVAYIDPDAVLSPGGEYAERLEGPGGVAERVRKLDGVHLCPAGAARLGEAVEAALRQTWGLAPPDASWRSGTWALEPRYDEPRGSCPA